jgi:hypothetical protein
VRLCKNAGVSLAGILIVLRSGCCAAARRRTLPPTLAPTPPESADPKVIGQGK